MNEIVLYDKNSLKITKIKKLNYCLTFNISNNHVLLPNIINFDMIKLIYDLNPDIYENVVLNKTNETEAKILIVYKNLFEDLGLLQKYSYIHIEKITTEKQITFNAKTVPQPSQEDKKCIPDNLEQLKLDNLIIICNIIDNHNIQFNINIFFNEKMNIPSFIEKIICNILNKLFNRIKQFIENI